MRIGVLTGGGDCPGLNAALRAVVMASDARGWDVVGFADGWRGPMDADARPLGIDDVADVLDRGGTILGSSRTNPVGVDGGLERVGAGLAAHGCDALVAIGGEDTLGVANTLARTGVSVVGIPKTIDDDLGATDVTIGHSTAVGIATEAVDRVRTTAQSHLRPVVVEVMGRHAGWLALRSAIAGGAQAALIPERPFDLDEVQDRVAASLARRRAPVVVVAEGALPAGGAETVSSGETDAFGHIRLGGVGEWLAARLDERNDADVRAVVLGHVQRGGPPSAFDRELGTRLGLAAVDAVAQGSWGSMAALRGEQVELVALADAVRELKLVPAQQYDAIAPLLR
ncbi:6-phosphofructokinase 1 [Mumia flava]|uniref:Pyrophosphate--fructose 6-phosphate 1-phosphotransferase n=1 Tax=Mumia flava TaxID=1348852 RepID=A0A0B2B2N2_9ACTN|nr:ATP-dependent 6-phosphofructokinase [Mumia flava]PJJ56051.1 6-phosphofructokinase 1 [Mumia flava]